MASNPYIIGDSSPFLKRVLIPFWVLRVIIMLVEIALYGLVITGLGIFKEDARRLADEYNTKLGYDGILATSCIICAIIIICLILDIVCIIKRARRTLSPPFFFGVNLAQTVIFTINFILTMIGARNGVITIALGVFIYLSFLGLLIYASLVFHRYRKGTLRGTYVPAHNPEAHNLVGSAGFAGGAAGLHPQPYAHDYPKTDSYYDQQAASQAQAYEGVGYPAPGQQQQQQMPYEPGSIGLGFGGHQQGYEMQRQGVANM